ncbi:MAG: cupin domain-containing protein [Spirulina sp. SIO3F2]|nr:cupin domain-containing protein [Spirulina sp. SIO3F2]
MEINNIFASIPSEMNDEIFEVIAQNSVVKIERIISYGHRSPASGWYDQIQHEWVMVVQGTAILEFEGDEAVTLQAGDYLNIPAHTKHKVTWTTPDMETIWLAIHYE